MTDLLFDNGTFQAYLEDECELFFMFGDEYAFNVAQLSDFLAFLRRFGLTL
jgi:hypothetical protein